MNCILVTLLVLGGGGEEAKPVSFAKANVIPAHHGSAAGDCSCQTCKPQKFHHTHPRWGMMPQSCYQPTYGCYPGSRHMHRYPAFHGTFYRRPYNYRNTFDYPWHAQMHEPTSHFSYNVKDEQTESVEPAAPIDTQARRAPTPAPVPRTRPVSMSQRIRAASTPKSMLQARRVTLD